MKIEQPKIGSLLDKATDLESCIHEDPYVQGKLFEDIMVSSLDVECLHLDGCVFKNVFFEDCHFPLVDMVDVFCRIVKSATCILKKVRYIVHSFYIAALPALRS